MASWPLHLELEILYRDGEGRASSRRITVKAVQLDAAGNPALFSAHCSLSGSFQDFATERIERCLDLVSGEQVADPAALARSRYAQSRAGRLDALRSLLGAELTVLLSMGQADGLFQQREKELIATYLCSRQGELQPAEAFSPQQLASQLAWLERPSAVEFGAAVEALAAAETELLEELFATCLAVADVREAREGGEQPALDQLEARWFGGPGA
ncbi:MAG: hypothetical protein VKI39_04930 [Synechococcus sp.]|nr:hypothetical protein [Synechococcus sp.]